MAFSAILRISFADVTMNRTRSKDEAFDGHRNVDRKRRMARPRFPGLEDSLL